MSLPHILSRLEKARKNAAQPRKGKKVYYPTGLPLTIAVPSGLSEGPSRSVSLTDVTAVRPSKGKQRAMPAPTPFPKEKASKAWWLDVANPNWDDLRTIGKLLHLHPLTLEDILQRDMREKLELFPRLGYRFIVFRATDNAITSEPFGRQGDEGLLGEASIYLVVFRDGICTVSQLGISRSTVRIRNRIELLEDNVHTTSDWIAHGLLDSVVNSFFPILREIEKEQKIILFLDSIFSTPKAKFVSSQAATTATLRRIARTRRLVTSLTRLLASKSEVLSRVRKRYLDVTTIVQSDDVEIAMYMGDVHDHILALQQALSHYEHILSQSHPIYLSQLRMNASNARTGSDKAVLILSLVSFGAMLVVIRPTQGAFSMNIHTPRNTVNNPIPSGDYYWFGVVLAVVVFVECGFLALVRYWWVRAKRQRQSKLI
ncbi:hypothetical protein M404DRAFT_133867 [Pisolithus tinctorius Marx 270]|uniref:Magnesium transporter n=1 Tax=Pisolithus tinctorius Marx 270 TaxID=870435 RepID=A0A0C3P5F0_PISTI|nr:hypothetical protein M404DRAFT_133867 [Pisolithus tinctorius Marx 270]